MNKAALLVITLLCISLGSYRSPAYGGDISLSIVTTAMVIRSIDNTASTDMADIKISVTNKGNETARDVVIETRLLNRTQSVTVAGQLLPGKSCDVAFKMPVPGTLRGSYPLHLKVRYQHPNGQSAETAALALLRASATTEPTPLVLDLKQNENSVGKQLIVRVVTKDPLIKEVDLTCVVPAALTVEQRELRVRLDNGTGTATFNLGTVKGEQGNYSVYVVAEAESHGSHELASSAIVVPTGPAKILLDRLSRVAWQRLGYGGVILTVVLGIVSLLPRRSGVLSRVASFPLQIKTGTMDAVVLAICILFILLNLNPQFLVTQTTTTGGDTASHYYTLDYLRHVLLPSGKISGWTMGNYAGFPLLQFYFPLPFLLMCLLNVAIPLQVAFKIVSILGTLLLPVAAYLLLRCLRRSSPAPILGAIFTVPFLFHSANSMWGANILSTLAGEFSYSLSFSLSLMLLGTLYHGARHDKWVIGNAVLVFLVGFSHGYTLLFVEAVSLFFLITPDGFIRRFMYLFKVYALGFLLLAFWLVPLLIYTRFTTSYHLVWTINSWREIIPPQILPFALLATVGSVVILWWSTFRRPDNEVVTALTYLWFGIVAAVVFFIAAPKLGVVDIRYVPYGQLLVVMLAAISLGWLARFLPEKGPLWTLPLLCMLGVFIWVGGNPGPASGWAKWNYEGFEAKPVWPTFKEINSELKGGLGDPRVVFEHSEEHNVFGSSRAFESLPLFAGRSTLEGLYMQASISAPFVFYLQSEISAVSSAPFPQYEYTTMNFEHALPHLRLFNVGTLVIRSDGAKKAIRMTGGYSLKKTIGAYELWEVTANSGHYVEPLAYEPVLTTSDQWKIASYRWFMDEKQLDRHLVFGTDPAGRVTAGKGDVTNLPRIPLDTTNCRIKETISNEEIRIETNWIGKPLLVKVSYHPNWRVEGADRIYLVSPSFMLIYPTQSAVRLYYGRGWPDKAGALLTILGLAILALNLPLPGRERKTLWQLSAARVGLPTSLSPVFGINIPSGIRKIILAASLLAASLAVAWFCYNVTASDPDRLFSRAIQYKDAKRFDEARRAFRAAAAGRPFARLSQDSFYYVAVCYYLEQKNSEAITAFSRLINDYPKSLRVPEALYHIGLCQFRLEQQTEGIVTMKRIVSDFSGTEWAKHAKERLAEKKVLITESQS